MQVRKGFTLIELLVVISIIAVLLTILLPSLGMAKEQSRALVCQTNLRQYGLAMFMYLDDNNRCFPTTNIWLKNNSANRFLMEGEHPDGVFWKYISSFDIHLCPSFSGVSRGTDWEHNASFYAPGHDGTQVRGNYSMNSYLGNNGAVWGNWLGSGVTGVKKDSDVRRPSSVLTFTEENPWIIPNYSNYMFNDLFFTVGNAGRQIDNFGTFHRPRGRNRDTTSESGRQSGLNAGSANLVFVDGRVDSVPRAVTAEDLNRGFKLAWPKAAIH